MSMPGIKRYTFESAAQWKSGASRQLAFDGNVINTSAKYAPSRIAGSGPIDRTEAFTSEFCADVIWVRETWELVRPAPDGLRAVGRLSVGGDASSWKPVGLVSGKSFLWLQLLRKDSLLESRLLRFDSQGGHRRLVDAPDRPVLAICPDRRDGVWAVVGGDGRNAETVHITADAEPGQRIDIGVPLAEAAIDTSCCGKKIVVLDSDPQLADCDPQKSWRLWSINLCDKDEDRKVKRFVEIYSLPKPDCVCHSDSPAFRPELLAVDCDDRIHLMEGASGEFWTMDTSGDVLGQHSQTLHRCDLPAVALAAGRQLCVSARTGVFSLTPTKEAETTSNAYLPTFISPTMMSPDGEQSGWLRADIEVDLYEHSVIEVNVATSSDRKVADQINFILANDAIPRAAQLAQVESRLPWVEKLTRRFQADGEAMRSIHMPLHAITDTFVWLRLRIYTESGATPPALRRMRVYYPNISYLQYLPAVFRENKAGAEFLRSFLATFEALFGNIDTELAELPSRIDPATAPNAWLPYLLRWLGLPAAPELSPATQRRLLTAAPELLRRRGTMQALEQLLSIVSGNAFEVLDSARGAAPWTLPDACRPGAGSRLGNDTLVLGQARPAFRLGRTALLKTQRLGYQKTEAMKLFLRRHAFVEIRIAAERSDRDRLRELLDRHLPYFIPAHCRYVLRFVAGSQLSGHGRLDEDLRLARGTPRRLGDASKVGRLSLAHGRLAGAASDLGLLDEDLYLS